MFEGLAGILGGYALLGVLWPSLWGLALAPPLIYLVARYRLYRESLPPDPHVGLKTVFAHFAYSTYQLALVGLALLVYGLLTSKGADTRETILRTATGILLPSVLLLVLVLFAFRRTNHVQFPHVGRMYAGLNRFHVGGMFAFAVYLVAQTLVQRSKDIDSEVSSVAWSILLVYAAAFGLEVLRVRDELKKPPVPTLPAPPLAATPPPS
jgi:MFS family permease